MIKILKKSTKIRWFVDIFKGKILFRASESSLFKKNTLKNEALRQKEGRFFELRSQLSAENAQEKGIALGRLFEFVSEHGQFSNEFRDLTQDLYRKKLLEDKIYLRMADFLSNAEKIDLLTNYTANRRPPTFELMNFLGINFPMKIMDLSNFLGFYERKSNEKANLSGIEHLNALRSLFSVFFTLRNIENASKKRIFHLISQFFNDLSPLLSMENVPLIQSAHFLVQVNAIIAKRNDYLKQIQDIYEKILGFLLAKGFRSEIPAKELVFLITSFLDSHFRSKNSLFLEPSPNDFLMKHHARFLGVFLGNLQGSPEKKLLMGIENAVKLGNIIGFNDSQAWRLAENAILRFESYKEVGLFEKCFISVLFESESVQKTQKISFNRLKSKTGTVLARFFAKLRENCDIVEGRYIIKALNLAKLTGNTELVREYEKTALRKAFEHGEKVFDSMGLLEIFRYYLTEVNQKNEENNEFTERLLLSIQRIDAYHYIFELLGYLAYKTPIFELKANDERKVWAPKIQNIFHCFGTVFQGFLRVEAKVSGHNRMMFWKTLKNLMIKERGLFWEKGEIKFLELEEYCKIFNIGKGVVKLARYNDNGESERDLIFPIPISYISAELSKIMRLFFDGKDRSQPQLIEDLKYLCILKYILSIVGIFNFHGEINEIYRKLLLNPMQMDKIFRIKCFHVVFQYDQSFLVSLEKESSFMVELQSALEAIGQEEAGVLSKEVIFLVKVLRGKGLKFEKLWERIGGYLEGKELTNLEDLNFQRLNSQITLSAPSKSSFEKSFEKLDPSRLNGASALMAFLTTPIHLTDHNTLFHFEKVISKDILTLEISKLGKMAEKLEVVDYHALKLALHLKKMAKNLTEKKRKTTISERDFKGLTQIIAYLNAKKFIEKNEIEFNPENRENFIERMRENPEIAFKFIAVMIELSENPKELAVWFSQNIDYSNKIDTFLKKPKEMLLYYGIIDFAGNMNGSIRSKLIEKLISETNDDIFLEAKTNINFLRELPLIAKTLLLNTEISSEKSLILSKLIRNSFQTPEHYRYWFSLMLQLSQLAHLSSEIFKLLLDQLSHNPILFKKLNPIHDKRLTLDVFCFFLEFKFAQKSTVFLEASKTLEKKVFSLPLSLFEAEDIKRILMKMDEKDRKLANLMERAANFQFREDDEEFGEVFRAFCESGKGSIQWLESAEKRIFGEAVEGSNS